MPKVITEAWRAAQARHHAEARARNAQDLGRLEAVRSLHANLKAAAEALKIAYVRAQRIWTGAGHGRWEVPEALRRPPQPRRSKAATDAAAARRAQRHVDRVTLRLALAFGSQAEDIAARDRAIAHARRTAPLPPVTETERDRLVAAFLAQRAD